MHPPLLPSLACHNPFFLTQPHLSGTDYNCFQLMYNSVLISFCFSCCYGCCDIFTFFLLLTLKLLLNWLWTALLAAFQITPENKLSCRCFKKCRSSLIHFIGIYFNQPSFQRISNIIFFVLVLSHQFNSHKVKLFLCSLRFQECVVKVNIL